MKKLLSLLLVCAMLLSLVACGGPEHDPIADEEQIFGILEKYDFWFYRDNGEMAWYGTTTDGERIALAGELKSMFSELGYDMRKFRADSDFAQALNNYYDKDKSLSIFDSACNLLDIDGSRYATIYDSLSVPALDASLVGIWNNNMVESTIVFYDDGTAILSTSEQIVECTYTYDGVTLTLDTPDGTVHGSVDDDGDLDICVELKLLYDR